MKTPDGKYKVYVSLELAEEEIMNAMANRIKNDDKLRIEIMHGIAKPTSRVDSFLYPSGLSFVFIVADWLFIIKPLNYYTILLKTDNSIIDIITYYVNKCVARLLKCAVICFAFVI